MTKRLACLSAFLVLVLMPSFGSQDGANSQSGLQAKSQTGQRRSVSRVSRAAMANWSRMAKSPSPAPTQIGFLSGTQIAAAGGTFPSFPAVIGDFTGSGVKDVAAIVNNPVGGTPVYSIAVELNDGKGGFTTKLTPTGASEQDPIFVGNLSGHANGEDDVLIVHPYPSPGATTIEGWVSNGDGTFTSKGTLKVTTNGFVWATLADVNGDGKLDVVLADAASPKGNICTALGNGDGTFGTLSCVAIVGALNAGSPSGVPGNPVVFADFNGDGFLDFAAASAGNGSTIAPNQIVVYLNNGSGGYDLPTALVTPDTVYDSCFLGGGVLHTGGKGDLVSANCDDNSVTVYVNNGTGGFATGFYYAVASRPVGVTVADVNNDGKTDIVASCFRSADIKVLLGDGSGAVAPATVGYVTGGSPLVPPLVADFHGDVTKPDVVVPDNEFSFVYLEGYGDGSFRSAVNYYAEPGGGAQAQAVNIATGDFNGDGIPDFVIGNFDAPKLSHTAITVFLSNSNGSLNPGVNYYPANSVTNYSLQYVAVADFNGDGKLDIAASDNFNGVVQIFTGNGDGTFATGATYKTDTAAGANPVGLIVGDFNGDGKPDLAIVNNHGGTTANVGILINNGNGGFNSVVNYPLSTVATEITTAALRGTGKPLDLVVPLYGTSAVPGSAVAILLGNGNGTFGKETDVPLTNTNAKNPYLNPYAAAVGDLNGDGKVDLAVTIEDQTHFNQGIAVVLGNGDGTFQANPVLLPSTLQNPALDVPLPGYVKIVDMNQDGIPDLVYSNSQFATVGILYGKGGGAFYDPVEFPADRWAWGLAVVDLNGDGGTDVVVSGNSLDFSGVAVLFNDGGNKTTLASSSNPSTPGAPVTFAATVASDVRGVTAIPTGNVTFKDGSTTLGSAALNSSGVASFAASGLADGPHAVTAQYGGDSDVHFLASASAVLDQSVGKADGVVLVALKSSLNPSMPGQSVTFTATVADTVTGEPFVPTGAVKFYDGSTFLVSVNLSAGVAAFSTSTLAPSSNPHGITAQYSGDANFAAKISSVLSQTVLLPNYSLSVSGSQTVNPGSSATYKITQTANNGYKGTVNFPATACSGLPSGTSCSFSPSSVAGSGSTTLTISTTGPTAALIAPQMPRGGALDLWASLGGLGLVGVVLAGDWSSRKRRRLGTVLAVLAVMFLITLVGCGGGGSSSGGGGGGGGGGTAAGTYSVVVTVTDTTGAGPSNGPLKVTLIVN